MAKESENFPSLHDWEIVGLKLAEDGLCCIYLTDIDREKSYILRLMGVVDLYVSDVRVQNVILDSMVINSKTHEYFQYASENLRLDTNAIDFNLHKLIYIEPSVGCEVSCLCVDYVLGVVPS